MNERARNLYLIGIIAILLASGCIQKNVCPRGQDACNGSCYNITNETCCKGKLYTGVMICCGEGVCQGGYDCCNGTCYDPKKIDCFNGRLIGPSDLLPENISQFRQIDRGAAIKMIAGKEVQEASAAFVPTGDGFNYVKAVLVWIIRYHYEGDVAISFNGTDRSSALKNAIDEKKKEIINESSAYYNEESNVKNELPSDIRFMIQNGQVNRIYSASGSPLSSESYTLSNGQENQRIDISYYYMRISPFLKGNDEETKGEAENAVSLFNEAILERIQI